MSVTGVVGLKINLNGVNVRIITARSVRARKTFDFEFTVRDELKVILPTAMEIDLEAIINKNLSMLERKHEEYLTRIPVFQDRKLLIKGEPHELVIEKTGSRKEVIFSDNQIVIHTSGENRPEPILKQWMTKQTQSIIDSIQKTYALEVPAHLRIVDTARWGYLRDKTIHINNQLVTLPPRLQEFIVVHEHLHLQHMNHGAMFQTKLSEKILDYPIREQARARKVRFTRAFTH